MRSLEDLIDATADAEGFSGVVRVDRRGRTEIAKAYGYADRAYGTANAITTQFGTASATKGFTALTVMRLVEEGRLALSTTARSLLGDDLPEIADDVTVEQLLAHRSGIGDYFDESGLDGINDHALPVPVHQLSTPEEYLKVLAGHPTVFAAGEGFAYNNGGYVVLALLSSERATPATTSKYGDACSSLQAWLTPRSYALTSCQDWLHADTSPSTGSGPTCCISPSSG